jgi:Restriction endonuclease
MFRRGRRHEVLTEQSSPGVDEQPFWLADKGVEPDRFLVAPKAALLRYDMAPWLMDQELREQRRGLPSAHSALRGVSTEEVLEALATVFSPTELDWDLVGVTFVHADTAQGTLAHLPVEVKVREEPPWTAEAQPAPAETLASTVREVTPRKPLKWLPEHDEIMAAVRDLSWEGYRSLIADIFRLDGYEVFGGEGPDGDVIDMEVVRGAERMLVNCQLRGMSQIGVEPLAEMAQAALRNEADGVFIISDGDFTPEAWSLADGQALILIDRENLLGLVLDLTLGAGRDKSLKGQVRRLVSALQPAARQRATEDRLLR